MKEGSRKQRMSFCKTCVKNHVLDTYTRSPLLEVSCNAQVIHKTISSSNGFFWWSVTAIHWIQPFDYSWNTKGYRTEPNLWGIRAKLELSFIANTTVTFQSRDLQRYHKQAGFHISPSHHVAHAILQIHVCLSSEFFAFKIFDWSPKRECFVDRLFVWRGRTISSGSTSLLVLSSFSIKNQWLCMGKFVYLFAY